jgi:hypothetical protein
MRKRVAILFATLGVLGALAPVALADTDFGPGNSRAGPSPAASSHFRGLPRGRGASPVIG